LRLDHDNIVKVHNLVAKRKGDRFVHYLIMEYIDGETLDNTRVRLTVQDKARLASEINGAVDHMYSRQIEPRDCAARNLMLTKDGHWKYIDLGLYSQRWASMGRSEIFEKGSRYWKATEVARSLLGDDYFRLFAR
jgi:serine/threonine protein kinase